MMAWSLFYNPMHFSSDTLLLMLIPLCAVVTVVYKTIRIENLRRLPWEAFLLICYMLGGLAALAGTLWLILEYWG